MNEITREPVMDAIRKIEHSESDAMADAVMEHLGPLALTHGHISPIDAFELGWNARAQTLASKEAELASREAEIARLRTAITNLLFAAGQIDPQPWRDAQQDARAIITQPKE